ncbi:Pyrophosphate--fructose 6-phosphate 1-phosphotransferase OS=Streptomyces alboniger OX=132473 GN=pfp PE=3 SV=1 [Streptomyces alboniger]
MPKDGDVVLKDQSLDSFGHVRLSGVGEWLAKEIEKRTGNEARTTVLGHIQRGRHPQRLRPLARHPLRAARHPGRPGPRLRQDGRPCAARTSSVVPIAEASVRLMAVDP